MIYAPTQTFLLNSKEYASTFDVYIPGGSNKEIEHYYSTKRAGGTGTSFHFRLGRHCRHSLSTHIDCMWL
ncbi:protein of unknown function [Acidithiobacillus ferrivorans]|uniref:Uncharacterized protein n=1 Tax=Acidithiobacillus ferrivorans TaxID=160808 RepID=A0A060UKR9_9PROT|nr:hypothetical protein AFERRI_160010 [Acidithiobacillus ferrivorans]SMH66597.1 protein of unknown function [Acidithiobacillus ferrivorans]